ncbi:MAG: Gfo/Idh/MocA family oxidoreductase [Pyrinomonadaceae bacterium]|nr:Gfo/Idh/MocA family oxidoreductase [Phycisphaerales bacterium]
MITPSSASSPDEVASNTPREGSGVTRRSFVKAASVIVPAVAGAVYAPSLARAGYFARGEDKLRIGVIGCGGRGTGAVEQALMADPGCVLVAMGDVFKDRVDASLSALNEQFAENAVDRIQVPPERQFVGLDAYQKVIDSGVDVVLLTSYPCFRPQHLQAAIAAGKHVFAEKPLAVDGPGIRSVLASAEEAKKKNLAILVGFCWRYNAGMRRAFEQVDAGTLGPIVSAHTTYLTGALGKRPREPHWKDLEFQMRNWWHFTWISGDHIVEQAVHSIDRLAWATGDVMPTKVTCLGGRAARSGPEHGNVFDHFAATYEYENGLRTYHTCRQQDGLPSDNTDYVHGTHGYGSINGWTGAFPMKSYDGAKLWDGKGDPNDAGKMYFDEHKELFASIRAGKPINDCVRGANSCLMAIMARMAAYTGQTISWEQALSSKESLVPANLDLNMTLDIPPVAVPGKTKFV